MHIGRRFPLFSVNHGDEYVIFSAINKMLKELGSILEQKLENMQWTIQQPDINPVIFLTSLLFRILCMLLQMNEFRFCVVNESYPFCFYLCVFKYNNRYKQSVHSGTKKFKMIKLKTSPD